MEELITWAFTQFQSNQFLITAIFGIIAYLARNIPFTIYLWLKRNLTTELDLDSQDDLYSDILTYCEQFRINLFARNYALHNNQDMSPYPDDDFANDKKGPTLNIGFGTSILWYKNRFVWISRSRNSSAAIQANKETANITIFSRNKKYLEDIITETYHFANDDKGIKISKNERRYWSFIGHVKHRNIDTVFIPKQTKNKIIDHINWFMNNEEWYAKRGINYKLGILLHGAPGTGKSSLIRALASYFNKDLKYLDLSVVEDLPHLMMRSSNSLVVMEDIDCNDLTHKRDDSIKNIIENKTNIENKEEDIEDLEEDDDKEKKPHFKMSEFLNTLDGSLTPHNIIYIATTNHIEKLDPAVVRPGRFDVVVEIGFLQKEDFVDMIMHLYSDSEYDTVKKVEKALDKYTFVPVSGAVAQGAFFNNVNNLDGFLSELFEKKN